MLAMKRFDRLHLHFSLLIPLIGALACGDPGVKVTDPALASKIIIQGYLFPHQPVRILLTRNFPLETGEINRFDLLLDEAMAILTQVSSGTTYELVYNPSSLHYEYPGANLLIDWGETYRLDVAAVVDGKPLSAHSTTTVPEPGFEVVQAESRLAPLSYRQRDASGRLQQFEIAFTRSPEIDFYVLSILALEASAETFVYDNPYRDSDLDDVNFYLDDLKVFIDWQQNAPTDPAREPVLSRLKIQWFGLPFYGKYRGILYAAEQNFKDFFLTHSTVQDIDGNFHEPILHIEGDGAGVFGAALVDTVYFEVSR